MSTASDMKEEATPAAGPGRRLYRSTSQKVIGGVCGGLGEYFGVDPVWFRIAFVLLIIGGGSGILIYLLMWLVVPPRPDGYTTPPGARAANTGAAIVGLVFVIVGTVALVNTLSPSLGRYFWPAIFVVGGLALLLGGLNRDNGR